VFGDRHNHAGVDSGLSHVGDGRVSRIMEPKPLDNSELAVLAGLGFSFLTSILVKARTLAGSLITPSEIAQGVSLLGCK